MMASLVFTIAIVIFIVIVIGRVRDSETALRESDVLRDVRQVECEHTDPGLVVVMLHEMGNSTRTASGSMVHSNCSGNITFFTCQFAGSTIKVKAFITDLTEGEARNITCEAYTMSGSVPTRKDLGWITLTKLGNVVTLSSLSRPEGESTTTTTTTTVESTTTILQSTTSPNSSVSSTPVIVGTVVPVVALTVTVPTAVVYWRRRNSE